MCVQCTSDDTGTAATTQPKPSSPPTKKMKEFAGQGRQAPTTDEAAAKICELVDEKRKYYESKLSMRQAEHQLRMDILKLKYQKLSQKMPPE